MGEPMLSRVQDGAKEQVSEKAQGPAKEPLFTRDFLLASFASLSAFSSFYFLLATLPVYVLQVGGREAQVGLIVGLFSATAVLLRLPLGRASDERRKRPILLVGAGVLAASGLLYLLATNVKLLAGLRVMHGAGWALFGTTISALVAEIAPASRRGEAMGYYGMAANLAMAVGPALGVLLMNRLSFTALFVAAAGMALVALGLTLVIREPPRTPARPRSERGGVIERGAVVPSSVLWMVAVTYGAIIAFLPIYATRRGLENPGIFFTAYAVVLLLARGLTGKISDERGRAAVIVPGLVLCAAGLVVLALAQGVLAFIGAAVLYGLGFAALQPALMAMVVDRAPPGRRGAAMGTYSTAMDLGIGGGSFLWGLVAQWAGYSAMYFAAAGVVGMSLVAFLAGVRGRATRPAEPGPA